MQRAAQRKSLEDMHQGGLEAEMNWPQFWLCLEPGMSSHPSSHKQESHSLWGPQREEPGVHSVACRLCFGFQREFFFKSQQSSSGISWAVSTGRYCVQGCRDTEMNKVKVLSIRDLWSSRAVIIHLVLTCKVESDGSQRKAPFSTALLCLPFFKTNSSLWVYNFHKALHGGCPEWN